MHISHTRCIQNNRGRKRLTIVSSNLIEGLWGQIKKIIRRLYVAMPSDDNMEELLFKAMFMREMTSIKDRTEKQAYI